MDAKIIIVGDKNNESLAEAICAAIKNGFEIEIISPKDASALAQPKPIEPMMIMHPKEFKMDFIAPISRKERRKQQRKNKTNL
jgi:hypothetical protein